MNSRAKWRLIGLASAIGLMGLAIAFITVKSQRQSGALRARLSEVDSESFRIADEFRDFLRSLNNSLYRYGSGHDLLDQSNFTKASRELDVWIDAQKPRLTTVKEQELMQQIDSSYDVYLAAAKQLQGRLDAPEGAPASIEDYAELMKQSQHLFDLGQRLARAHYESRGAVLAQANRSITELRVLVLVSLGGLFLFGGLLVAVVYRDMIAPLRVKLVESQTLVERQEKLASLGMLAAGVAHEIRNPLTAIKAALFIQQKKFLPGTPEFADARLVEREILRLERIVNDFLLFARPSDPELAIFPVRGVLLEVQALLTPQLTRSNIQLLLEEPPPLRIKADAAQLKQVLINLVQNAADAIGTDGVIKLRAYPDHKRLEKVERDVVILEVTDNGKGIPPQIEKRLFDPFFSTKESGTGLGLSIASGIIQKHGGMLQYQTQVDYGTTFGIILPQATE